MPQIVLTEDQSRIVAEATGPVEVRSAEGKILGSFQPLSSEEAEAVARYLRTRGSRGPGIPSARVQAMLQKFHEIDEREGMTREKMAEILRRVKAGEPL
jgi:hypothetical protein